MQRWKTSLTLRLGGEIWQREFFDHLLRSDEKLEEKWNYVRENPVRAGLCANPDAYPYSGTPAEILRRINCRAGTPNGLPAAKGNPTPAANENPTPPAARTPNDGDARPTKTVRDRGGCVVGRAGLSCRLPAANENPTSPAARTPDDGDARPTMPVGEP
jgi:hypothetical protein